MRRFLNEQNGTTCDRPLHSYLDRRTGTPDRPYSRHEQLQTAREHDRSPNHLEHHRAAREQNDHEACTSSTEGARPTAQPARTAPSSADHPGSGRCTERWESTACTTSQKQAGSTTCLTTCTSSTDQRGSTTDRPSTTDSTGLAGSKTDRTTCTSSTDQRGSTTN